jgi:hypothetical protein
MTDEDTSGTAVLRRWDVAALRAGAAICLTMAAPFRVLGALFSDSLGSFSGAVFFLYLSIFVVGAGCAAWTQSTGTPLSHAVVAAVGTSIAVEIMMNAIRFLNGSVIPWFASFFTVSLITVLALIGGILGGRLRSRGVLASHQR